MLEPEINPDQEGLATEAPVEPDIGLQVPPADLGAPQASAGKAAITPLIDATQEPELSPDNQKKRKTLEDVSMPPPVAPKRQKVGRSALSNDARRTSSSGQRAAKSARSIRFWKALGGRFK